MRNLIERFIRDESGQDLTEYAILLGLVGLAVIAAVGVLGGNIAGVFNDIGSNMNSAGVGN